jgi:hypothetical protein
VETFEGTCVPTRSTGFHNGVVSLPDTLLRHLSANAASELLNLYRKDFIIQFPFVTVFPQDTVASLESERPIVLRSILAVACCHNLRLQQALGKDLQRFFESSMTKREMYTIDLLQALMIYSAWYNFFFRPQTQIYHLYIQFCMNLVHELGLDKHPVERSRNVFRNDFQCMDLPPPSPRTNEERRALLGTYYLAATFAQGFRKSSLVPYTTYIRNCCNQLHSSPDFETDVTIKEMIQMQNLSLRVNEVLSLTDIGNAEIKGDMALQALVDCYTREIKAIETSSLRRSAGFSELDNAAINVIVHEAAVHKELWLGPDRQMDGKDTGHSAVRKRMAWKGLQHARTYLEHVIRLPAEQIRQASMPLFSQVRYIMIVVNRFIFLDGDNPLQQGTDSEIMPSWDAAIAAKEAGIIRLGSQLLNLIASVTTAEVTDDGHRDTMYYFGFIVKNMLKGLQELIHDKQNQVQNGQELQKANNNTVNNSTTPISGIAQGGEEQVSKALAWNPTHMFQDSVDMLPDFDFDLASVWPDVDSGQDFARNMMQDWSLVTFP